MRKLAMAAAAAAMTLAGLGSAQATDQNINISATVNSFCRIAGSLTPADDTLDWTARITAGAITDTSVSNKTYAVVCNKASDITLLSVGGGMTGPAAAAGFENVINYTASASGFVTVNVGSTATTAGTGANETLGTAARGTPGAANIVVAITPIANTDPLVEGTYTDTLRVTISPQP
jgi:hypothetical protein